MKKKSINPSRAGGSNMGTSSKEVDQFFKDYASKIEKEASDFDKKKGGAKGVSTKNAKLQPIKEI